MTNNEIKIHKNLKEKYFKDTDLLQFLDYEIQKAMNEYYCDIKDNLQNLSEKAAIIAGMQRIRTILSVEVEDDTENNG